MMPDGERLMDALRRASDCLLCLSVFILGPLSTAGGTTRPMILLKGMEERANQRRGRRLAFRFCLAVLLLAALELLCLGGLRLHDSRARLEVVSPKDVARWIDWTSRPPARGGGGDTMPAVFDMELGWDQFPAERDEAPVIPAGRRGYASSYGDSFTRCYDVADHQTWQRHFKALTGRPIFNLGIGGAGTDQALLKLRKYYASYSTEVVIFGVFPNDISRNAGIVGTFYLQPPHFIIKPRFMPRQGGGFSLYNPIPGILPRARGGDRTWLPELARKDFWYRQFLSIYGLDMLRGRGFPYTLQAGRLAAGMVRHGRKPPGDRDFVVDPSTEPMRLTLHTIKLFLDMAGEQKFTPVILVHGSPWGARDGVNSALLALLRREFSAQIEDALSLMGYNPGKADSERMFSPGRHYSSEGNRALAKGLVRVLPKPNPPAPGG